MMIAILKDLHLRFGFTHPAGRTADFENQIKAKLDWVADLVLTTKTKYIILTGDTFDKKQPSSYGVHQVQENLRALKTLSQKSGAIILDIAGNHSLPYSSREYKDRSIHNMAVELGIVKDIHKNIVQLDNGFSLVGIDYTFDEETFEQDMEWASNNANIIVVHEHLYPDNESMPTFMKGYHYSQFVDKFKIKPGSVIIAGHLHRGFPVETVKGVTFINQWNFTRLARGYYELNGEHIPQISFFDTETKEVKCVKIANYTPFDKAFILEELRSSETRELNIDEFARGADEVMSINDLKGDNIESALPKLSPEAKERLQGYINQAEAMVG